MSVYVLRGEGLNCERESAQAFERFGAQVEIIPVRRLIQEPTLLLKARILVFPGGFSYGDEMQSGHILGLALQHALKDVWHDFMRKRGLVLGVCNGFQTLMKMGVFEEKRTMALVHNRPQRFIDTWVKLAVKPSRCVWTQGLEGKTLALPARHGEGRLWSEVRTAQELIAMGQVPFCYSEDLNGSLGLIAGLTDATGQILGMMPHPEAALESWLVPERGWQSMAQLNEKIFQNALQNIREVHHARS